MGAHWVGHCADTHGRRFWHDKDHSLGIGAGRRRMQVRMGCRDWRRHRKINRILWHVNYTNHDY